MDFLTASLQVKSMSIFEAGMIFCFGASWPFALYKTFKTKLAGGKSRTFYVLVLLGYICGILHKIFFHMDIVFWMYVACFVLIAADFTLVLIYRRRNGKINNEISENN